MSLHHNRANSYLFVNGAEIINFKAKHSKIISSPTPICLGNISEDFSVANMTGLYGYVYDFSVNYRAIAVDKIPYIYKYLMKKNSII